jgi:hypothetical protein
LGALSLDDYLTQKTNNSDIWNSNGETTSMKANLSSLLMKNNILSTFKSKETSEYIIQIPVQIKEKPAVPNHNNILYRVSNGSNYSSYNSDINSYNSSDINSNTRSEEGLQFDTLRKFQAKYVQDNHNFNSHNMKF